MLWLIFFILLLAWMLGLMGTYTIGSWLWLLRNRSLVYLTTCYAAVGYFEYLFLNEYGKKFKVDEYVTKPLEFEALRVLLRRHLGQPVGWAQCSTG